MATADVDRKWRQYLRLSMCSRSAALVTHHFSGVSSEHVVALAGVGAPQATRLVERACRNLVTSSHTHTHRQTDLTKTYTHTHRQTDLTKTYTHTYTDRRTSLKHTHTHTQTRHTHILLT